MSVTCLFCTPLGILEGWSDKDNVIVVEYTGILKSSFSSQLSVFLFHDEETLLHTLKSGLTVGVLGRTVMGFGSKTAPRGGSSSDGRLWCVRRYGWWVSLFSLWGSDNIVGVYGSFATRTVISVSAHFQVKC